MNDYSWNGTGEIDELSRTLEDALQCLTTHSTHSSSPPGVETLFKYHRHVRERTRRVYAAFALGVGIISIALLSSFVFWP